MSGPVPCALYSLFHLIIQKKPHIDLVLLRLQFYS